MLATPWARPFTDERWSFEPKWDGIRAIVTIDGAVSIRGRQGTDLTHRYPELHDLAHPRACVLDGEIVTLVDGAPSFERLQRRMHVTDEGAIRRLVGEVPVTFVAFDLLHDGVSVVDQALEDRRRRLLEVDLSGAASLSETVLGSGEALWDAVVARNLEGIVAKRLGSTYRPGVRSPDWRKIANVLVIEAVVGGFTRGDGGRSSTFGALLLGRVDGDALRYVGSVGTGFTESDARSIRTALDAMMTGVSPFHPDDGLPAPAVWVEPTLVASIGYRNITSAGRLRHPRFRGFTGADPATVT